MSSVKTPNFALRQEHRIEMRGDYRTLPSGAFVRPIELQYVPVHVKEDSRNQFFNVQSDVYCFTRYGIIAIPKSIVMEV